MANIQKSRINRDVSHIQKKVISGMEFMSIQDEEWREYDVLVKLPDGTIKEATKHYDKPQWLFVRPSGTHMILDNSGVMRYVPPFTEVRWFNGKNKTPANF